MEFGTKLNSSWCVIWKRWRLLLRTSYKTRDTVVDWNKLMDGHITIANSDFRSCTRAQRRIQKELTSRDRISVMKVYEGTANSDIAWYFEVVTLFFTLCKYVPRKDRIHIHYHTESCQKIARLRDIRWVIPMSIGSKELLRKLSESGTDQCLR